MFDNTPLTNGELLIFKHHIQKAKNGSLLSYKANDKCIANALCWIGSFRRQPICGTYASRVRDTLTKAVRHEFTEAELESIVLACMEDRNDETLDKILSEEIIKKLSCWIPVFMSRRKSLKDYLED